MVERALAVLTNGETYRRILYLLLAFPLGIAYFTLIVSGLTYGGGSHNHHRGRPDSGAHDGRLDAAGALRA